MKGQEADQIEIYHLADEEHPQRYFRMDRMETIYDELQGQTSAPHRHDFYTVIWVRQGQGYHLIDYQRYALEAEQVHFVSPGQVHQLHTEQRPEGSVMAFSPDFLALSGISSDFIARINLFSPYGESPPLQLSPVVIEYLGTLVNRLYDYYEGNSPQRYDAIGALLKLFLIECVQLCTLSQPEEQQSTLLLDFRKQVDNSFKETHKVSDYADRLFTSPKHLNQVVKDALGYTAKEFIMDRITVEAKRLLLHSQKSVKEIGLGLGFKEAVHFNSFFKKRASLSPLAFRRAHAH